MTIDYVLKRVAMFVFIILFAGTLNFALPRLSPTNPVEERLYTLLQQAGGAHIGNVEKMIASYEERFGLNNPLWRQYLNYLSSIARLDFGQSIALFPAEVSAEVRRALPWTIGLVGTTTVLAALIGSFFGAWLGWTRTPAAISFVVPLLLVVTAVPFYLLGLLLLYGFTVFSPAFTDYMQDVWRIPDWLYQFARFLLVWPSGGAHSYDIIPSFNFAAIYDILRHAFLPALAIVLSSIGFWGLGMRGMMVTTMGEDYIKLAEFKGLRERRVFLRYAVRNALLPSVTGLALNLAFVVNGSVLVEVLFAYPGVGNLLYRAITGNDYFLMQGIIMYVILAIGLLLLIVDLIYPLIDPRIRYRNA